jgi:putative colanic acid biosynthesis UDP-glucose lipid carrier transferase
VTDKSGFIRPLENELALFQRAADALWIAVANTLAHLLYGQAWELKDHIATLLAVMMFSFVGEAGGLYRAWRAAPLRSELAKVSTIWLVVVPVLVVGAFFSKSSESFSRVATILWFVLAPVLLGIFRLGLRLILRRARATGRNTRTVAIAGATRLGVTLAQRIAGMPWTGMNVTGFYDERSADRVSPIPDGLGLSRFAGNLDKLVADARTGKVDMVYIALPLRAEARIKNLVARLADTTASVHVVADFFVFDLLHAQWSNIQGVPDVSIFESPFYGVNGWLKRAEDLVVGTLIMAIIAIPMAIIALGVKLTSPGPVFFRQRRYGLKGEEINVLKVRSMIVCDDGTDVKQATKNDQRITPFGAFLRRTSLDELPQFFHVLTGEMSIVGPRPHAVSHNEQYRRLIHGYMLRHKVKPGITGWAQVNGWRGETDTLEKMERRVEYDLQYIRNWGVLLDLKIIFMTVFSGSARRNAY